MEPSPQPSPQSAPTADSSLVPPPPILIDDDHDHVRHDIHSDDMRRVHPCLPLTNNKARMQYFLARDALAYLGIHRDFPELMPPEWERIVQRDTLAPARSRSMDQNAAAQKPNTHN